MRFAPATSPYATHIYHSPSPRMVHSPAEKIPNPTASVINTPVTSPYSNLTVSRGSPASLDMGNSSSINYNMQPSPLTNSTPSLAAPKKRILNALKQEAQDEQQNNTFNQDFSPIIDLDKSQVHQDNVLEESTSSVISKAVSDVEAMKKSASAFLINTPSSSTTTNSSTSSSSSNKHFNYDHLPQTNPLKTNNEHLNPTNSSFQWPLQISQFRRQQSLNIACPTPNPIPTTPYTPPPMLSPFRKGPGLYYHVFSQNTPAIPPSSAATTPGVPFTPIQDEISGPKINIGKDYQADIPKLRSTIDDDQTGLFQRHFLKASFILLLHRTR